MPALRLGVFGLDWRTDIRRGARGFAQGLVMRVLLIEDTVDLGQAVREQIADDGHAVDWVRRLDHAELSVQSTAYDLILLDLMLPDGHGIDFLRRRRTAGNRR